jgi:microcystin degradation protein MlrC
MMTRIAMGGFSHETNTFSPIPTTWASFSAPPVDDGRGIMQPENILKLRGTQYNNGMSGFWRLAEEEGYEIAPLIFASTMPSAQVARDAFDKISDRICTMIQTAGHLDGIYLSLHGAMVVEGYLDGETELLKKVCAVAPHTPVIASLDLHGNITAECVELSSALVGFRTYPHVDIYETGYRCGQMMKHILAGKPLFKAYRLLPIMLPLSSQTTNTEPARGVYAAIDELEKTPGVLSASLMMGFPPADVYHCGPSVFAYAETQALAEETARRLADVVTSHEREWVCRLTDTDSAVQQAMRIAETAGKPVILADVQDNAGAGSTSDTTWILESLVKHGAKGAVAGLMYDPEAAGIAHEAGEGAQVRLKLGGKLIPGQKPYEAVFTVDKLADGEFRATGPMGKGRLTSLGKMALLRIDDVRVVVSSARVQANDQSYFRQVGVEPAQVKILSLKSSHHYRADFEPISSAIIQVAAPAATIDDPALIPYKNLRPGVRLGGNGPISN